MELEPPVHPDFRPRPDRRPRLEQPPPARLTAVDDVILTGRTGLEPELDAFYGELLQMRREPDNDRLIYRTDNFRLILQPLQGPIPRENYRITGIEVPSLSRIWHQLIDLEIEHTRQKGLTPGQESLILKDPAGNWIEITERKTIG